MNIIKGLIIKDLLQLKNYKKTLLIFIVIFIFSSLSQNNSGNSLTMLSFIFTFGFGMFSISSFNYDEASKADRYILTLPVTRKDVVLAKYLFVVGSSLLGSVLGIFLVVVLASMSLLEMPSIGELLSLALGGLFGVSLILAIQIPCIFKWGAEKGRVQLFIVSAIMILLCGIMLTASKDMILLNSFSNIVDILNNFWFLILPLCIAGIYLISYKVSIKIYAQKEF